MLYTSTIIAALAGLATARQCTNLTIPISITGRNGVFSLATPESSIDITNFNLRQARQGHNLTAELLTGYADVSGNYEISATLCNPDKGASSTVQVLTHGIGFDRSYWDFPYNNYNYSYVNHALEQGYSTFSWDRLGVGMSSKGEPVNEIQAPLEIAALYALTVMLREGNLAGASGVKFPKTIHIGHSFGSAQTFTLALAHPEVSDGIVLTGFSQNASFASQFILGSNFIQANTVSALSQFPTGYLAPNSPVGVHIDFFSPDSFDPQILQVAYMTGQPVTPGELLTLAGRTGEVNPFAKPVLIVTGEHDTPYCGGDCYATGNPDLASIPAASAQFFPNAAPFDVFIVPGTGHGLNFEYSHPTTYSTILSFLSGNGCAA